MHRISMLFVLLALTVSCSAIDVEPDAPALLTNPGPESLREIEQTVATALDSTKVTIAADALTKNSVLVVERGLQSGIGRAPELGRDTGRPYRFQLVMNGSQCALVNQQNEVRLPLTVVECIKE